MGATASIHDRLYIDGNGDIVYHHPDEYEYKSNSRSQLSHFRDIYTNGRIVGSEPVYVSIPVTEQILKKENWVENLTMNIQYTIKPKKNLRLSIIDWCDRKHIIYVGNDNNLYEMRYGGIAEYGIKIYKLASSVSGQPEAKVKIGVLNNLKKIKFTQKNKIIKYEFNSFTREWIDRETKCVVSTELMYCQC